MQKKYIGILLAAFLLPLVFGTEAKASVESTQKQIHEKEHEKELTENMLEQTQNNITGLELEKGSLQGELSSLNSQLSVVAENLEELEADIAQKEADIEETSADLKEAIDIVKSQYTAMKKRIRYMYENNDFSVVETMLGTGNFGDMLDYFDYVNALSAYDRKKLVEYKEAQQCVERAKKKLEEEQKELEKKKEQLLDEQNRVEGLVQNTSNHIAKFANEIYEAESQAASYEDAIRQQEADLKHLKKKLEEEIAMSQKAANSAKRDISQVTFAEGDRMLLANLIYCEAGNQPYAGQLGVGAVVINRVLSSVFPDTVTGVIYQSGQFSPAGSGRLATALAGDLANADCYRAADEAMSGVTNVGGCVYFRTPVEGLQGISIGGHIFY